MAISLRIGPGIGLPVGLIGEDGGGPLSGVTRDAASGIYCPANATEWAVVMAVAGITSGGPSLLWLCQEASGNLADSIGTFTGTPAGAPITYQQPVTGWTRLGVAGASAGTGQIANTAAGLPDMTTTSILSLGYITATSAPAADASIDLLGAAAPTFNVILATSKLKIFTGANTATGTANPIGAVRPYGILFDVTNNRCASWSDQEILAPTRGATTGKRVRIDFGFPGAHLYRVTFFGAAAELTNAQIRTLLQTLGWVIPW